MHPAAPYDGAFQKLLNRQLFRIAHNEAGDKISPSAIPTFGYDERLAHRGTPIGSGEKPGMTQQGIAAAVVEDLAGLKKLIADQHIGERSNVFGLGKATQWG